MITPYLNERVLALCGLIAEEKGPGKFQLLVHELSAVLDTRGVTRPSSQPTLSTTNQHPSELKSQLNAAYGYVKEKAMQPKVRAQ